MTVPASLQPAFERLPAESQSAVQRDYTRRTKSMAVAYLAWLFLGWHYLYLRRGWVQLAFWLTGGGLFIWWVIDVFRVAGMVRRMNEDTARELMVQHKALSG